MYTCDQVLDSTTHSVDEDMQTETEQSNTVVIDLDKSVEVDGNAEIIDVDIGEELTDTVVIESDKSLEVVEDDEVEQSNTNEEKNTTDAASRFSCGICGKGFNRGRNLNRHAEDVHTERSQPIKCTRCKESFPTHYEMTFHRSTCTLSCPYSDCTWSCDSIFKMDSHLRKHVADLNRM